MELIFRLFPIFFLFSGAVFSREADFPAVPDDFEVSLFAREPLVRNPCAITFDAKGRLCVGMGPQYRTPKPDTPGDSVWILVDEDGDGSADLRKEFATGFNAIQGLAWKGDWLWIANAPELTRVRDTDGDDVADEYIRVYTDLGNLEHGLHGLNFGPDGKLYMSKGNSKGLTQLPDRLAPRPFRELWGIAVPDETPEPEPVTFSRETYEKHYHDPRDDWGITGGILRCDDDGSNLEIVSRGFRNPWDICFDDGFNWLGTDNDQTMGDKIFSPFYGAHFGWGHSWSYDWKGDDHLPTAPSSGPLFEGSGAGVIFCGIEGYPEKYRNVFLINDWLNRETLIYRPTWDGAWMKPDRDELEILAHAGGGRSMPKSSGRAFDPVDIEIGPDGAIWITSWGRQYGAHYEGGKLANEGRIYRLWPKEFKPAMNPDRPIPAEEQTIEQLIGSVGNHLPVWRTNAQEELIRQGSEAKPALQACLLSPEPSSKALETWIVWTLGRIDPVTWYQGSQNQVIQSLRFHATQPDLSDDVRLAMANPDPRVRLEAVLAIWKSGDRELIRLLLDTLGKEDDRIIFYAIWRAMMELVSVESRKTMLTDSRVKLRLAAFLGLLEEDVLSDGEIEAMTTDPDGRIASLAAKRLGGKAVFEHRGRPLMVGAGGPPKTPAEPVVVPFENIRASTGGTYRAAVFEEGATLYTDRPYRIIEVPAALRGETFLQTACSDADPESGISVTLDLRYPATVFLADDTRAEALPVWAREGWEPTEMVLKADDPREMRLYRREVPAGTLKLGTNRDGVNARKGNYIVVVRPRLLDPDGKVANAHAVLGSMNGADSSRGRDLFFSRHGADCASCHRVDGIGNNHAPDLNDIGSRADAGFLVQSIIEPGAAITEGFAAQVIRTKSGDTYTGIVLEETGRSVKVALTGGATVEVARDEIEKREALSISAMPAGFASALTTMQIADLTAFLMTLKKLEPLDLAYGEFGFQQEDDEWHLHLGKTRIATWLEDDPVLTRRAFVNVKTPSGIPVTRPWPVAGKGDHPTMHPGIWIGFGWIAGNDYWRLQSEVKFEKFLDEPTAEGGRASFATRNRYLDRGGKETICLEDTRHDFERTPEGILLKIDAAFYNDDRDFEFGDQEESGLAIRMAKPLTVQFGTGEILNNRGDRDGAETWGKNFTWIDYSGEVDGKRVGILIVPHPENPRPSWSHSREYGVLVANPFPKQPVERREPYMKTKVRKSERFRLRYAILIHESRPEKFDPAALARKINP